MADLGSPEAVGAPLFSSTLLDTPGGVGLSQMADRLAVGAFTFLRDLMLAASLLAHKLSLHGRIGGF